MVRVISISILLSVFLSGCASIVGDETQLVPISSTPGGALIVITDEKGTEIFKGMTPTTVTLPKSDGTYWGKKSYKIKISKDGFDSQEIPVTASANGWYIGGNIIFGGLIGWFIVDPFNGAMYTLSPDQVSSTLSGKVAHNNNKTDGSISVILLEDVPLSLRHKMKKLH